MKFDIIADVKPAEPCGPMKVSPVLSWKFYVNIGITVAISVTIIFTFRIEIQTIINDLFQCGEPQDGTTSVQYPIIYDTNREYSEYIKGDLNAAELEQLNDILEYEKWRCGLALEKHVVKNMSAGNQQIILAYQRWRQMRELYRSDDRVVYPSERGYYFQP